MKNFHKIADGVNVGPLMLAIARRPELWKEDTYLRDYPQGPFGNVESIILRFPEKEGDEHENIDREPYRILSEARPIIMNLMAFCGGERLGRCIINKLRPGGLIFPHCDSESHAKYYRRFHVVLQSQAGANFRCEDEKVSMKTGEIWWFNNALEHEVVNNSIDDRIHLIVDIRCSQ